MTTITIITIVVIALLTGVIGVLAWLGYSSCIRTYRLEVRAGEHDDEIRAECGAKKKKKGLVGVICSYLVLFLFSSLAVTGLIYRISGDNFTINNHTALVIKTGSMSHFANETIAAQYDHDTHLQFDVGDICIFETEFELIEGEVYGYKSQDKIITHRLVQQRDDGLCEFRGDANSISDGSLVQPDHIFYHYTGNRVPALGAFVLYAQSYFGLWSLGGEIGVLIGSEIVWCKITNIQKKRYEQLEGWHK